MKQLEAMGLPRNRIIDGRVFKVPNLDFPRLINEGVAYGSLNKNLVGDLSFSIYPRIFFNGKTTIKLGMKSYIVKIAIVEGEFNGEISLGKFCSVARETLFNMRSSIYHNYNILSCYTLEHIDWFVPNEFYSPQGTCKILIGNDVWIGRGCNLKCTNPERPLIIGDGAVIASDSVVVKSVPPYAIVGGNPAQIIKYRFPPHIIEALLRIKWWDWSLDKIHDNFKYFNDVEKFISLHDKEG